MELELSIAIIGLVISSASLIILPLKIKTGRAEYFLLYIFLVLFYLSLILYAEWEGDVPLLLIYLFEMLFFLNMYRAYLKKELFFAIPAVLYFNDLAVIFSFYFVTFNLVEIGKGILHKRRPSLFVFSALLFFEGGVILQIMEIITKQQYLSSIMLILFVIATVLFIVPGLRVAYEEEKV